MESLLVQKMYKRFGYKQDSSFGEYIESGKVCGNTDIELDEAIYNNQLLNPLKLMEEGNTRDKVICYW